MRILFFFVALLALGFWGFSGFNVWAMLTGWQPYADLYGADLLAWIQGFPIWRKAIWGASVGFGVIGALMMLARVRGAGLILLLAWLLVASGFAYDVVVQEGVRSYGQQGVIASAVLIVLAASFAWAGFAATSKSAKAALVASSSPAHAVTAPEPTPQPVPAVVVAPAPTPAESPPAPTPAEAPSAAAPTPTEAPPPPIEASSAPTEPEPSVSPPSVGPATDSLAVSTPESAAQDASIGAEDSDTPPPTSEDKPIGG